MAIDNKRRQEIEESFFDAAAKKRTLNHDPGLGLLLRSTTQYAFDQLGSIEGKIVVDFGCGSGNDTVSLAKRGANVYAFDISHGQVEETLKVVEANGLSGKVKAERMTAEDLLYPADFADLIFGRAILHHVELEGAINEVNRILKRGGKAIFIEPLGHNLILNMWRKATSKNRTHTQETILLKDIEFVTSKFPSSYHREFCFMPLLTVPIRFMFKKLFYRMVPLIKLLETADGWILNTIPHLKRYCWVTVIVVQKQ